MIGLSQGGDSTRFLTIRQITIEGNQKTRTSIITRELSFKEGDTFKAHQFDSLFVWNRNRVYNTNLFNDVSFSTLEDGDGGVNIRLTVAERWYIYPIPIFKLVDRNFNDWWVNRNRDFSRVNYGVRLAHFNFTGQSDLLRLTIQGGFTTWINFFYRLPYVDKTQKQGLITSFSFQETKNLPFDTENNVRTFLTGEKLLRKVYKSSLTYRLRNSFYFFHFITFGHTSAHIADTIAILNPNYFESGSTSQNSFRLGYRFTWDKRDNRNYPLNGEWYAAGIQKYGLGIYDDVDFWSMNISAARFRAIGKDLYYANNIIGLVSLPQKRSYFNYFAIGFLKNSLRGHDLTIIEGSTYFIQKNELKKKLFSRKKDISRFHASLSNFKFFP